MTTREQQIAAAAQPVAWQTITKPGQVKVGDKLRFTIGSEKYSETAKQILHPGTDREEIIYNKRKNYYLITSMAIKNAGSSKNVMFLAAPVATVQPDANAGDLPISGDTRFMAALDGYMDAVTNEPRNTDTRIKLRQEIFAAVHAWHARQHVRPTATSTTATAQAPAGQQEPIGYITEDDLADLKKNGVSTIYEKKQKRTFGEPWTHYGLYLSPPQQQDKDGERIDWLNEQVVNLIYLDDGRMIDCRGNDCRRAIDAMIEQEKKHG